MHADWLTTTMPEKSAHHFLEDFSPILSGLGIASAFNGLYKLQEGGSFLHAPMARNSGGYVVGASGGFLEALRAQSLYATYLAMLGDHPHNVTRLDVAHDVSVYAPPHIRRFEREARKGNYKLNGRKINLQTQFSSITSLNNRGDRSGSVYLGPRKNQKAALLVYDKAKEQWDKFGRTIPDTLRFELKLGRKIGMSLRDAWEPDPIFWHHMADILPAPDGVPTWRPHDGGFDFGPRVKSLPAEAMKRLVESSDLTKRLLDLADQVGEHGLDHLFRLLKNAYESRPVGVSEVKESA